MVTSTKGIVATSHPLATGAAVQILEAGGTAGDAAVAAAAVLNVTEPHMTGIGGDMFMIFWSASEGQLSGLDSSGQSGSKTDPQALIDQGLESVPETGPKSVTVPGALAGWQALLDRYGLMSMADVLAPAIRIAEDGFLLTPIVAQEWADSSSLLQVDEGARATYLRKGQAPRAGERITNLDLANSLRTIAQNGIDTFYGKTLGQKITDGLDKLGGYLTIEDLADHTVRWVEPMSVDYKGYTLHEIPPAGQGIAALQMIKILEEFDVGGMRHNSVEYLHTLIEVKRLAYADLERHIADPAHMTVQPESLLDGKYLKHRATLINPCGVSENPDPRGLYTESETVYLTVADQYGNMISFINSLCGYFGSGVVIPETGILLQNRGSGFTLEAGHPNQIAPRKKPLHTIIPAFVTQEEKPLLSFGVMGGSMQPQGQIQVLLNMIEFGMDIQQAINAPRFRHLNGVTVAVENLDPKTTQALQHLGHKLEDPSQTTFGGSQAILNLGEGWAAGSDVRKDGMAAGH